MLFFWTFYSSKNPEMYHSFQSLQNITQQLFSKLIIRNVSWAENQFIRMIFEGSCDTEVWKLVSAMK